MKTIKGFLDLRITYIKLSERVFQTKDLCTKVPAPLCKFSIINLENYAGSDPSNHVIWDEFNEQHQHKKGIIFNTQ